jgi:hypothetical protein
MLGGGRWARELSAYIQAMTRGGKRLAWRIAASLAAGVVLTVGVAWGHAIYRRSPDDWVKSWLDGVGTFTTHYGAPFEGMMAVHRLDYVDSSLHWSSGLQLPEWLKPRDTGPFATPIALPLMPIWPGFALNTVFYGGVVFLLWSAPGFVRRRRRLRRGQCLACGYDLRATPGKPCPECGS